MALVVKGIQGGEKARQYLEELKRKAAPLHVRAGILEGAVYPDGTPVALVGYVQEHGAPSRGIPPRSFMRSTVMQRIQAWKAGLARELKTAGMDSRQALDRLGHVMVTDFKKQIRAMTAPALKMETIRRKGFDKLLIHKGDLVNALNHEVKGGTEE